MAIFGCPDLVNCPRGTDRPYLSACPDLQECTDTLDCAELTRCLDEAYCTVSPNRPELPVCTGLSTSTVEPGRPSSSDCMDLPDRLDFSSSPVPPDYLTDFSVDTKYPVTVSSELSPADQTGKRRLLWGAGMSFTEENPENSDIPELEEGFKETLES